MILTPERRAQLSEWGRKGGAGRAKQFTRESQQAARAQVKRESLQASGRAGYEATRERFGDSYFGELLANFRRKHPNAPTRRVRGWLHQWGYHRFDLDAPMGPYFADIWLYDHDLVIEIDGKHWHEDNDHVGYDREAYDAERLRFILRARRCCVIRISDKAIMNGSARDWLKSRLDVLTTLPNSEFSKGR